MGDKLLALLGTFIALPVLLFLLLTWGLKANFINIVIKL